jgi:hypothetical protein
VLLPPLHGSTEHRWIRAALVLWLRGGPWQGRTIAMILATCWLFVAWAYLLARYDTINWAASYFAAGYAVEALLLVWTGLIRNQLSLRPGREAAGAKQPPRSSI